MPIIEVNGNTSDNDTLTFTGTNLSETYNINTAAAATDADRILQLFSTGTSPLLVLRKYTGFITLNVYGLDGVDTFQRPYRPEHRPQPVHQRQHPQREEEADRRVERLRHPPRPKIIQSTATQDPTSGLVEVIYNSNSDSKIQYAGIENVTIKKQ